jgi:large subunit ribosomal protein L19
MAARTGEVADKRTKTGFAVAAVCDRRKTNATLIERRYKIRKFMNQALQDKIESEQYRKDDAKFAVGDSVKVHTKVIEGDKERIQIFAGVVMGKRGHGLNETFTVRRISYGEGVERVFPLHSPRVDKIEVERQGSVRRAKLTYLRKRLGKGATLVREKEEKIVEAAK